MYTSMSIWVKSNSTLLRQTNKIEKWSLKTIWFNIFVSNIHNTSVLNWKEKPCSVHTMSRSVEQCPKQWNVRKPSKNLLSFVQIYPLVHKSFFSRVALSSSDNWFIKIHNWYQYPKCTKVRRFFCLPVYNLLYSRNTFYKKGKDLICYIS